MKHDSYCTPSYAMSSTNPNDAKKECTNNRSCHMFYDWGRRGRVFYSCDSTTLLKDSEIGSILYQVLLGNNTHTHTISADK